MSWLWIAIAAQFLLAVSVLIDRHIVVRAAHIGRPIVYTFYTSVLSGFVVVIAPFGLVSMPSSDVFFLSLLSAAAFVAALYYLYSALRVARASDAAPVIGAISALTSLALAWVFVVGDISAHAIPAVLLLVAGTALISRFHFHRHALMYAFTAGGLFGAAIFLTKLVYNAAGFLDGFFWTRVLALVVALSFLALPSLRRAIFHGGKHASRGAKTLVLGNKVIASSASVLTAYAVSLGSVAVVNSLAGLQFAFLFVFSLLFANFMPRGDDPMTHGHGGWRTGLGVSLIMLGLAALFLT